MLSSPGIASILIFSFGPPFTRVARMELLNFRSKIVFPELVGHTLGPVPEAMVTG